MLIDFEIRGDPDDAADLVDPIVAGIEGVQADHPDLYVGEIGDASAEKAVDGAVGDDLKKAGILSVPITLIILLIALGALVAAGIPLLIGLTAVARGPRPDRRSRASSCPSASTPRRSSCSWASPSASIT